MPRELPQLPNLEHLKKQAKLRLRKLKERKPEAKLADAQRLLAREYNFASWAKLKAQVEALAAGSRGGAGGGGTTTASTSPSGPGQFERYTQPAKRTIFFARYWAHQRDGEFIETEHLLQGVIQSDPDLLNRVLHDPSAGDTVRAEIERRSTAQQMSSPAHRPLSMECRRILQHAAEEADRLGHHHISTDHILLGFLTDDGSPSKSILLDVLKEKSMRLDQTLAKIRAEIRAE